MGETGPGCPVGYQGHSCLLASWFLHLPGFVLWWTWVWKRSAINAHQFGFSLFLYINTRTLNWILTDGSRFSGEDDEDDGQHHDDDDVAPYEDLYFQKVICERNHKYYMVKSYIFKWQNNVKWTFFFTCIEISLKEHHNRQKGSFVFSQKLVLFSVDLIVRKLAFVLKEKALPLW